MAQAAGESPFLFIGEAVALDLINTEMIVRGNRHDALATGGAALAWWMVARQHHPALAQVESSAAPDGDRLLDALRLLRGAMRRLFTAVIAGRTVAEADLAALNTHLALGQFLVQAQTDGGFSTAYRVQEAVSAVLLPIALSAARLLTEADLSRLHHCQNERCILLFYDATKNGTRQWCSTACMDRARSRRRYASAR